MNINAESDSEYSHWFRLSLQTPTNFEVKKQTEDISKPEQRDYFSKKNYEGRKTHEKALLSELEGKRAFGDK